jgi:hypothetical protein
VENKLKLVVVKRSNVFIILIALAAVILPIKLFQQYNYHMITAKMVMGGKFYVQTSDVDNNTEISQKEDVEKYFRPSKLPVLNDRLLNMSFSDNYYNKELSEIELPKSLLKTPEDTIINYFSTLREAANPEKGKKTGCGTLGNAKTPYPTAYKFLSTSYQEKLSYEQYLDTFKNILHINLIKIREIPVSTNSSNIVRYFVEIETIEGSEKGVGYFAYYYGFVDMIEEGGQYKISNIEFIGENYLCAPYHGWDHNAELVVDIKYGSWCSLVKERYPTVQEDYVKKIYFKGTDGYDYLIEFFQLTNDTDVEIAQYKKNKDGNWELIKLEPKKCLDKK